MASSRRRCETSEIVGDGHKDQAYALAGMQPPLWPLQACSHARSTEQRRGHPRGRAARTDLALLLAHDVTRAEAAGLQHVPTRNAPIVRHRRVLWRSRRVWWRLGWRRRLWRRRRCGRRQWRQWWRRRRRRGRRQADALVVLRALRGGGLVSVGVELREFPLVSARLVAAVGDASKRIVAIAARRNAERAAVAVLERELVGGGGAVGGGGDAMLAVPKEPEGVCPCLGPSGIEWSGWRGWGRAWWRRRR